MTLNFSLANIATISALVPLLVFIFNAKTLAFPFRVLALLLLTSLLTEAINLYLMTQKINSLGVVNAYTVAEFTLLAWFYYLVFTVPIIKQRVGIFLLIGLVATIISTFSPDLNKHLNNISLAIESLAFISLSLLYFSEMLKKMAYEKIWHNPYFWVNSAILVYFAGSFFVFIFSDFLNVGKSFQFWHIHNICSLLFYFILAIGFWKARKTSI